jgi:hypothetical protein
MTIHRLAIFWRAQQARCFTYLHFTTEHAAREIATEIAATLAQLSQLHLYGAALDSSPLPVAATPASLPLLITHRLGVKLFPAASLAPRHGVTLLQFAIPQPITELTRLDEVRNNNYQLAHWQLLQERVFPFLCLPNGIGVKPGTGHTCIKEVALIELEEKAIEQLRHFPFEAALAGSTQDLEQARVLISNLKSKGEEPAERDYARIIKLQNHLAWLMSIEKLETEFFHAAHKPSHTKKSSPVYDTAALAVYDTAILAVNSKDEAMKDNQEKDTQEIAHLSPDESSYLPTIPVAPYDLLWQDVGKEAFFDPARWLHRAQLKQLYQIEERSYFRWINELKELGLTRNLPAQHDAKMKLFYRPDVDNAVTAWQARKQTHKQFQRRAAARTQSPLPPSAGDTASAPINTQPSGTASAPASSSPAQLSPFEQLLIGRFDTLAAQQKAILHEMAAMNKRLEAFAASTANQPHELMARTIELVGNLSASNNVNAQLLASVAKLDNRLKTLPASIANAQKTAKEIKPINAKSKPKTKAKTKLVKKSSFKKRL